MDSFRSILETKLSEPVKEPIFDEKTIQFLFTKIIESQYGVQGKSNVLPLSFKKGILTLGIYKSLWQSEITLIKEDLKQSLNKELGGELITEIRIQRK